MAPLVSRREEGPRIRVEQPHLKGTTGDCSLFRSEIDDENTFETIRKHTGTAGFTRDTHRRFDTLHKWFQE